MSNQSILSEIVDRAASVAGSAAELARRIGVTRQAIYQWKKIPIDKVVDVEAVTGIPRESLRPDVFQAPRRGSAA